MLPPAVHDRDRPIARFGPVRVMIRCAALLWAGLALAASPALGQESSGADELAAKATDPTAALMSFQFNNWYTASFHDAGGSANQLVFRSAVPFTLAGLQHIFRITAPWVTSSPSDATGFADITLFDLVVFDRPWGRWGAGVSGTVPTGQRGLTLDKWTAGPALGFVNSSNKQYRWGLFAQSFFSFAGDPDAADAGIVNVQPIFSYQLGGGRSVSLGNSAVVYDTERSRWSSLLLGLNYGQVVSFAGRKWRPNIEVDYEFKDDRGNQEWVFRLGIVLLLPAG